jgi:hypothetical protein
MNLRKPPVGPAWVGPPECLVRRVLEKWYRGRKCAFCERDFAELQLFDHKPGLLNPKGVTVEWRQIPLSAVNKRWQLICPFDWNGHIAQRFRREHPKLVVDRSVRSDVGLF